MSIEIVLCERDKQGNKTGGRVRLTGDMIADYRRQRAESILLRGKKGKKRQKAREQLYGPATDEN